MSDPMSTEDMLQNFMQTSSQNILFDRERSKRLERRLKHLKLRDEATAEKSVQGSEGLKAWRVKLDASTPSYNFPHHEVEPYITWYSKGLIFFDTKGVTEDNEKTILLANLIREKNYMLGSLMILRNTN